MVVEQVWPGAEPSVELDDDRFSQRVDRRVGDLGETLAKVGVDRPGGARHGGERRIVAHGPDSVLALGHHRFEHHADIFARVAESPLQTQQLVCRGRDAESLRGERAVVEQRLVLGRAAVENLLHLVVFIELVLIEVDTQHLPGAEAARVHHALRVEVDQAGFGADDHEIIVGDEKAAGTQADAVEHGAEEPPVGEDDGRGAVPVLDRVLVIGEESGLLSVLGGRQHQAERLGDGAPVVREQLGGFVERGGVGAVGREDRLQLLRQCGGAGVHARAIAPDGVDLAVVGERAQGLRAVPRGRDIGRVALVKDSEGRGVAGV